MNLAKRKHNFVHEAMHYLDCYDFHVSNECEKDNPESDAAAIAKLYGVEIPDGASIEIRVHLDYKFEDREDSVDIRINYKSHFFKVAVDELIDLAFMHYAQIAPMRALENQLEYESSRRIRKLVSAARESLHCSRVVAAEFNEPEMMPETQLSLFAPVDDDDDDLLHDFFATLMEGADKQD